MSKISYDRVLGPTTTSVGGDLTTTTLAVTSETAPTTFTPRNYVNFVAVVTNPGDTEPTQSASCVDSLANTFTLIKGVQFDGYGLDVFSRTATTVNAESTITVTHQPSKRKIILSDEWYNVGSLEKTVSAYASTSASLIDVTDFRTGQKEWLVYAVLALGGSSHSDSITIPGGWNLLHDTGTNIGDGVDVRMIVCYQLASKKEKIDFTPTISSARVWGAVVFACKVKS